MTHFLFYFERFLKKVLHITNVYTWIGLNRLGSSIWHYPITHSSSLGYRAPSGTTLWDRNYPRSTINYYCAAISSHNMLSRNLACTFSYFYLCERPTIGRN